jgi:hypothetical protein
MWGVNRQTGWRFWEKTDNISRDIPAKSSPKIKFIYMANRRLTTILMLLMAIMPIVVAFGHYSDIVGRLSALSIVTVADNLGDEGDSASQHSDHCQPDKAHLASCSFHVCVDCAIASYFGIVAIHGHGRYSDVEKSASVSLLVPPDIKPPIIIL